LSYLKARSCAKVYKDVNKRGFHKQVSIRKAQVRIPSARAMRRTAGLAAAQEEVWQNAEVDALYRLAAAGVRVRSLQLVEACC